MTFVQTHSDQKKKVTPTEGGYCGKHICFKCGWPFPNPHPSAKHRRAHNKVCGKIEGYEPINLKGKNEVSFSTSYELCFPETQEPYDSHNANAGMVTNTTTFVRNDAEVNQIMELTEEDNARDHEEIKIGKCDLAKYESKEEAIPPNLVLENATLVRESSFGPVDVEVNNQTTEFNGGDNPGDHERDKIKKYDSAKNKSKEGAISPKLLLENATFNQRTKLVGGDNAGDYEKDNIEKCNIAGSESKEGSIEAYKIPLSEIESARNLGQTEPKHYTSSVSGIVVLMEDEMIESKRNLGQTEPYHYKSSLSEIEDGKCDSARNLQTTGSKHLGNIRETGSSKENPQNNYFQERIEEFEFYENCEIQKECAEESSTVAKLSHAGAAELLQNTSQKLTLKDILNFQAEDESSSQNATAVIGNSYESSGYEGFSSQQNALSDVDADALAPTDSYTSSQDKKANMKYPKAATDQYFEDALNDYERRTCRPLFDLRSADVVVEKPRWRKKIVGIFTKFGLQKKEKNLPGGLLGEIDLKSVLKEHSQSERKMSKIERKPHLRQLSCCSSPRVNLSHKRKAKEWELQLQKYISENSPNWVGPRSREDREEFPPNNLLLALAGAGILWMGWTGFNGGDPFTANVDSSMAVLNTHICAATSLLVWTCWDVLFFKKPSVIGAIQGMITGLVCITPGAGLVQGWAALVMGIASGTIPWYTMMVLSKKLPFLQKVDDTLGVFHTHAVAGTLGGALTGLFAHPHLSSLFLTVPNSKGSFYGGRGGVQFWKQLAAAAFIIGWNVVATSIILNVIRLIIPLKMTDEEIKIGDDAAHGEEAYALQGQGRRENLIQNGNGNAQIELEEP